MLSMDLTGTILCFLSLFWNKGDSAMNLGLRLLIVLVAVAVLAVLFVAVLSANRCRGKQARWIPLPLPGLVDLSGCRRSACVQVLNRPHRFARGARPSGLPGDVDASTRPIFGSVAKVHGRTVSDTTFGLPFFRFRRGTKPHVKVVNRSGYTFNLHWHGMNVPADIDGSATQVVFGDDTSIGTTLDIAFPAITNNSSLLWVHPHPMLRESPFLYAGLRGLVQIVDDVSAPVDELFHYGDNHLMLVYQDTELLQDGTQTQTNLYLDETRSCFGLVNGTCFVNWANKDGRFTDKLRHVTHRNLIKVDLLNGTTSFRYIYVGVQDGRGHIVPFWVVQTDGGLCNPSLQTMVGVAMAGRVSLLIDADGVKGPMEVFLYDYDLTEVYGLSLDTPTGFVAPVPTGPNQTPYPTPIPDPGQTNPQQDYAQIDYPKVASIPQVNAVLVNGNMPRPTVFTRKRLFRLEYRPTHKPVPVKRALDAIRRVVFGTSLSVDAPDFEYGTGANYLSMLNPAYFYNLPNVVDAPTRWRVLFGDSLQNAAVPGGNPLGATEYIDGANRVVSDMWNSAELDLDTALVAYNATPNAYQPATLPTCLMRIFPTVAEPMNLAMLSNDTLVVQFFAAPVAYGDTSTVPLGTATVVFPPTTTAPLNIGQWQTLVNEQFAATTVTLTGSSSTFTLGSVLAFSWSFFPYQQSFLDGTNVTIKGVILLLTNTSAYYVRFLGSWSLLMYFGKPIAAMNMPQTPINLRPCPLSGACLTGCKCGCARRSRPCGSSCSCRRRPSCPPHPSRGCSCGCATKTTQCHAACRCRAPAPPKCHPLSDCHPNCACGCTSARQCHTSCHCRGSMTSGGSMASSGMSSMTSGDGMAMGKDGQIQQMFAQYATTDPENSIMIMSGMQAELIVPPNAQYRGFLDGMMNDGLTIFAVQVESTERWIYVNLDSEDSHAWHFHLTQGFVDPNDPANTSGLVSADRSFMNYLYSKDVYGIGPQQTIAFYLKFPTYTSADTGLAPGIPNLGFMMHCHMATHVDMGMMNDYFVFANRTTYF